MSLNYSNVADTFMQKSVELQTLVFEGTHILSNTPGTKVEITKER